MASRSEWLQIGAEGAVGEWCEQRREVACTCVMRGVCGVTADYRPCEVGVLWLRTINGAMPWQRDGEVATDDSRHCTRGAKQGSGVGRGTHRYLRARVRKAAVTDTRR
ncbi:hypothetical protein HDV57DRAFT_491093 [Trichoderma longibrachiatum]